VNVVDSSGWLEYFAGGSNADFFAPALEAVDELVVPTVSIYEVFKRVLQQRGEGDALQATALMQQGDVVELSVPLALEAARRSVELQIPMADAIILTMARASNATLWTQDSHFEGIAGVQYVPSTVRFLDPSTGHVTPRRSELLGN
jgi:predicted nucleic acid-binding protein